VTFHLTKKKIVLLLAIGLIAVVTIFFTYPPAYRHIRFPDGRKFAFSVIDDTDGATLEKIKPVYEYFQELGIRSTKTIWVLPSNDPDHWPNHGSTIADSQYLAFVLDLQSRGFEIALHGVRGGDSSRDEIITGLETFRSLFGEYPRIHINHSGNRDNLYWGSAKLGNRPFRWLYNIAGGSLSSYGHDPESEYFWGDIAKEHISYCVNFSFHDINVFKINPLIPYHDASKPYLKYWFHTSDGGYVESFNELIRKENVDRLEREGGICFVYTHLASGFFKDGELDSVFRERLGYLASRNGWFAPASEVLDYIRENREGSDEIGFRERVYIELWWLYEKLLHGQT
jgi:hypothetical protein